MSETSTCPTCSGQFETDRGMKVHHAKAHGESIAFVTVECAYCGSETEVREYQTDAARNYCGDECKYKDLSEYQSGENNPYWKGGRSLIDEPCQNCGGDIEHNQTRMGDTYGRFCSLECYGEWQSENITGEDHPSWQGGKVNYYGSNWLKQRRKALLRDQYRCQICRVTAAELDREPDVHHLRPIRTFDNPTDANGLENLITLCHSCHGQWEGIPVLPEYVG